MGGAHTGGQLDDRAVIARRRVYLGCHVQQFPAVAEALDGLGQVGGSGAAPFPIRVRRRVDGEGVGQLAPVVADEGVVESGVALQAGLRAAQVLAGQQRGHDAAAGGVGLVVQHLAPADARPLGGAAGEGACQGQRGDRLVFVQAQQLGGGHCRAQRPVDRAAPEAPRLGGGDEVTGDAGFHLVARGHGRQQFRPAVARQLRRSQRRRDDTGAGVNQHPVGIGLVGGVHQLAVGEGRAAAGGAGAVGQHRGAVGAGLLFLHQFDGGLPVGRLCADEGDEGSVQQRRLQLVHHRGRQLRVVQSSHEPGVGAGEGFGHGVAPFTDASGPRSGLPARSVGRWSISGLLRTGP